jgi:hypothetical protein
MRLDFVTPLSGRLPSLKRGSGLGLTQRNVVLVIVLPLGGRSKKERNFSTLALEKTSLSKRPEDISKTGGAISELWAFLCDSTAPGRGELVGSGGVASGLEHGGWSWNDGTKERVGGGVDGWRKVRY